MKHSFFFQLCIFTLLSILIITCRHPQSSLEMALQKAGSNQAELEKVLRYYQKNPKDSLKYKAACFLIENMPYYNYPSSKQLDNYKNYYLWLRHYKKIHPKVLADSIRKTFGPIGKVKKKYDIEEIDSAYLCNNIEWAFKVWNEQPWGKNISFKTFCEYILPYRIKDEPLEYWREKYYNKFNSLLTPLKESDSLDIEDPIIVANYLIRKLPHKYHRYTGIVPYSFGHIGAEHVQYLTGSCREVTDFAIYLFRSLGIPCTTDFIPVRSNVNANHFWLTCWDKEGEEYMTDFPRILWPVCWNWWYKQDNSAKTYRTTFSLNRELSEKMNCFGEEIYPFWNEPTFIDVTGTTYGKHSKNLLKIPLSKLYKEKRKGKIAYLCLSYRKEWKPVDWTEYNPNNLEFRNIRKGGVMRIATYEDGELHFITDPFYIDRYTNKLHFYSCSKEKQTVILYIKYHLKDEEQFLERMIGGAFEGSNRRDFSEKDTLFVIREKPHRLNTVVQIQTNKRYRYARYIGSPNTNCNIAEVAFYGINDTTVLTGNPIGTPGCFQRDGSHEYTNVFDGKSWTSFDYIKPSGGWAGLDFGTPKEIHRIVYTPRNRDNFIRKGDIYELFYCDGKWQSAGQIKASSDSLTYNNIPKNTLLLLRNYTRGDQERIFIYENNAQIWK